MQSVRKAEVWVELNLVRSVKDNKVSFCKYISSKRKPMENVLSLLKRVWAMVTQDMEKSEVLKALFTSLFTSITGLLESQALEIKGNVWSKECVPLVKEEQVRVSLSKLHIHKSMSPDGMHHEC